MTANVVVMMRHTTRQQLQSRSIRILFYRLDPLSGQLPNGTRENITPASVGDFIGSNQPRLAEVTPEDLKKAAETLPQ